MTPDPTRILINPHTERGRRRRFEPLMRALGEYAVQRTSGPDDLTRQARRAAEDGVRRLVVVGGDGTLHHVAQGLAGSDCALGVVPMGTGNDLARALGLPLDPAAAARVALHGATRPLDLGCASGRLFLTVAGGGFSAAVAARVNAIGRRARGAATYAYAMLRTIGSFDAPHLTVEADHDHFRGRAMLVAIANTAEFGGGMRIAPGAVPDDGQLDVVVIERVSALRLLWTFPQVYRGRHLEHPAVHSFRSRHISLRFDRQQTLYGDGEPLATTDDSPIEFTVRRRALRVAVARPSSETVPGCGTEPS